MSQFPNDLEAQPYGDPMAPGEPAKTSTLAVGALISSCIFCCPITTVLGFILGVVSAITIQANPQRKGMPFAILAIVIGLALSIAWVVMPIMGWQAFQNLPKQAIQAGYNGNYAGFREAFTEPGASASDDEVEAFIDTLRTRYGDVVGSSMDFGVFIEDLSRQGEAQQASGAQMPKFAMPVTMEFENATLDVQLIVEQGGDGFYAIRVLDPAEGDVVFPAELADEIANDPALTPGAAPPADAGGDGSADEAEGTTEDGGG